MHEKAMLYSFKNSDWPKVIVVLILTSATAFEFLPDNPSQEVTQISHLGFKRFSKADRVPHLALIVYRNVYCSGSLVKSRLVVSAASCFEGRAQNESIIVKIGSQLITGLGEVLEVVELKVHEYFGQGSSRNNDIALLMLKNHVTFSKDVKKIILVESDIALRVGAKVDVAGWGGSNLKPKYMNALLVSDMMVLSKEECRRAYFNLITSSNFCVSFHPERRLSDNGGPAESEGVLVGIVSFGTTKSDDPYVAVLTNVSYFNKWIVLNAKRLMRKYCVKASQESSRSSEKYLEV